MMPFRSTDTTLDCVTFLIIYFLIFLYDTAFSLPVHPYINAYRSDRGNQTLQLLPDATTAKPKWPQSPREYADVFGGPEIPGNRKSSQYTNNEAKRGLDIGLEIKIPTTSESNSRFERLEQVLEKALQGNLKEVLNSSSCPSCDDEPILEKRRVKPAYKCDEWDAKYRLCILERNIGDTVTFYLSTGSSSGRKLNITWRKEFHMQDSKSRTEFVIEPENSPENMILGKQGYELRISPITETDIGYNLFSATLMGLHHPSSQTKLFYMIRVVPIDLGFVYVGETVELSLRSFVSLPAVSLNYIWYMEKYGEHSTLPSNMRTSIAGSSIKISELRQEQEGVLACSVYTNLKFLATKKRFLIKDLVKNNDVLKSPPDHNLHFKEERSVRGIRGPKKPVRHKRSIDIDDLVEKALMQSSTTEVRQIPDVARYETSSHSYDNYDVEMDLGNAENQKKVDTDDNENSYMSNSGPDVGDDFRHQAQETHLANEGKSYGAEGDTANKFSASKEHSGRGFAIPESSLENGGTNDVSLALDVSSKRKNGNNKSHPEFGKSKDNYGGDSRIILNIDKIPTQRLPSAEIKIAKLISFCHSDFECAGTAACVKDGLHQKGFCRCLPGFYGVGIFCREDVSLNKDNLNVEEFHGPEEGMSNILPLFEETN